MAQHFLLSAKARTLSLASILRMSDDDAHAAFVAIRFADNGGAASLTVDTRDSPAPEFIVRRETILVAGLQ